MVLSCFCFLLHGRELDANRPSTLLHLVNNKCGVLMLLAIAWLWFEALRLILTPHGNRRTIRW